MYWEHNIQILFRGITVSVSVILIYVCLGSVYVCVCPLCFVYVCMCELLQRLVLRFREGIACVCVTGMLAGVQQHQHAHLPESRNTPIRIQQHTHALKNKPNTKHTHTHWNRLGSSNTHTSTAVGPATHTPAQPWVQQHTYTPSQARVQQHTHTSTKAKPWVKQHKICHNETF